MRDDVSDDFAGPEDDEPARDPLTPRVEVLPDPEWRHPWFIEEDRRRLPVLFDSQGYPVILFDPVPLQRQRRHGWDARRQQRFVDLLPRLPSISHACKVVGMSRRSLYALIAKPGAEQFAKAIDMALAYGIDRAKADGLSRSLEGVDWVPVRRGGRIVRYEQRRNDKLAIAVLNAGGRDNDAFRTRSAQTRWRQQQEWAALDAAADKPKRYPTHEEIVAEIARMTIDGRARRAADPNYGPRIRRP
jgi:hypothetical protein